MLQLSDLWRKELRVMEWLSVLEGDMVKEVAFNDAVFEVVGLEVIEAQV